MEALFVRIFLNPLEFRKTFCAAWTVLLAGETKSSNLSASRRESSELRSLAWQPAAVWHLGDQADAVERSARGDGSCWSWPRACPRESGGLVEEDQAARVKPALMGLPPGPAAGDVGAVLFAGVQRFF